MTIQELEQQLLNLDKVERIRLIQLLTQSLLGSPTAPLDKSFDPSTNLFETSIVDFFRNSPLCEVADELDLTRDQSPIPDRITL
jgi:hypothetical protein